MSDENATKDLLGKYLQPDGPTCLVIRATLEPVGNLDRFQPAGFPEVGHVLYDAPRKDNTTEKVCIVDSPASMANHLETICLAGPNDTELHADLDGLPYVVCVTDRRDNKDDGQITCDPESADKKTVCSTLTEGHRIASDYFLDSFIGQPTWKPEEKKKEKDNERTIPAHWEGKGFRDKLREEFGIVELKKDKTYFIHPEDWWNIYSTIFKYDPNSLIHGVMFAKEQIKISRLLTAHHEAFGAARVSSSGVKFNRLGKRLSGQPIFAVDEETANEIRVTIILDLALLRSYGRNGKGLDEKQKKLLLGLALWKIKQLLSKPFRFRTQCHLKCTNIEICDEDGSAIISTQADQQSQTVAASTDRVKPPQRQLLDGININELIKNCNFEHPKTSVYYPVSILFKFENGDKEMTEDATTMEDTDDIGDSMED
jgi:CRISPR-associated protein Csb1